MSESTKAVFLSYASQDVEAAMRICEKLRGADVEVWFDRSELRGGDAWDAQIRRQIRECALFVPIISANTQARQEGYFRLEWHLAEQRSHLIARGRPFIVPVVVDETSERSALVPDSFLAVQWMRMPPDDSNSEFVERLKALLESGQSPAAKADRPNPGSSQPPTSTGESHSHRHVAADAKSIAVLPFANLSPDADNAFFCDGVHEDILTSLANIGELRVISRTSVMQYRDTTKSVREIAQELGVAYILEGSVRRAGVKVRLSGQLIKVTTDEHVWAKQFDRDITDVFAIQSELAKEISIALKAALTVPELTRLEQLPTRNIKAYELELQARRLAQSPLISFEKQEEIVALLQQAVSLDPGFTAAWTHLAAVHGDCYFCSYDRTTERLAKAREAIETAVRLAPEDSDVLLGLGSHYARGYRDWKRARFYYEAVVRMLPNHAGAHARLGSLYAREGRWADALKCLRKAHALDPRDLNILNTLANTLGLIFRFAEAEVIGRDHVRIQPNAPDPSFVLAMIAFTGRGSTREMDDFFYHFPGAGPSDRESVNRRVIWAWARGDAAELLRLLTPLGVEVGASHRFDLQYAQALMETGDLEGGRKMLVEIRKNHESERGAQLGDAGWWAALGRFCAFLHDTQPALEAMEKAVALLPESLDAIDGPFLAMQRACVLAWIGDKREAVQEVARLLRKPSYGFTGIGLNIHHMRAGFDWAPLRDRADFQALLSDPKNNAPLF